MQSYKLLIAHYAFSTHIFLPLGQTRPVPFLLNSFSATVGRGGKSGDVCVCLDQHKHGEDAQGADNVLTCVEGDRWGQTPQHRHFYAMSMLHHVSASPIFKIKLEKCFSKFLLPIHFQNMSLKLCNCFGGLAQSHTMPGVNYLATYTFLQFFKIYKIILFQTPKCQNNKIFLRPSFSLCLGIGKIKKSFWVE